MVDFGNRADVHAASGLIEYDQLGLLDQRLRDDHLLLIAAREFNDLRVVVQRLEFKGLGPTGGEVASRSY